MSALTIASITFAFIFSGAMGGILLRHVLPERHIDSEAKDTVRVVMALVATLFAFILGLLISSAKGSFDRMTNDLTQSAANIVLMDRVLAHYGPETRELRELLKNTFSTNLQFLLSGDEAQIAKLDSPETVAKVESIGNKLRELSPQNEGQRALQSRALQISGDLAKLRWLVVVQRAGGIPMPLLAVLVAWVSLVFAGWGLFAPRNPTVTVALFVCALCVSGAVFLLLEMDQPLTGLVRISGGPLTEAIRHLGQ